MSIRFVSMNVLDATLSLVGPGEEIGEDTVPEGEVALVIGCGIDAVAVIGTPQQLRERVYEGLSLPVPAGVSLVDAEPNWNGVVPWPTAFTVGDDTDED